MSAKIIICYAREDEKFVSRLKAHLEVFQHLELIDMWYDREISPGTEWAKSIDDHLSSAQIILLLVSQYFIASDYCYSIEMKRALERHKHRTARVIPIILRPVHFKDTPLGRLQVLPSNSKAITTWLKQDSAYFDVAEGVRKVAEELREFYLQCTFEEHVMQVNGLAIHPDGHLLVSGGSDSTIKVWNLNTKELVESIINLRYYAQKLQFPLTAGIHKIAFSQEGQTLFIASEDGSIKVRDLQSGNLLYALIGHASGIWGIALSSDGRTLVSAGWDSVIKLWNLPAKRPIRTITKHKEPVLCVAMSPDGQVFASGSMDNSIKLWDLHTGKLLYTFTGHSKGIHSMAISPDGQTLVSGSWDGTIKLWDFNTKCLIRTLTKNTEPIYCVAVTPDGKCIISGGRDDALRLWDAETGEILHTLVGHYDGVHSLAITLDGQTLISGDGSGVIRIWKKRIREPTTYQVRGEIKG